MRTPTPIRAWPRCGASYEGDNDGVAVEDTVRSTTGEISMRVRLADGNTGALLRGTGEQLPGGGGLSLNQAADVIVDGVAVGRWSRPVGNPYHRWLADTFALPASVTTNRTTITVTLRPDPLWTGTGYQVDSVVPPVADASAPSAPALTATAGVHANRLSWTEATDDIGVVAYRGYGADGADVRTDPGHVLGTTPGTEFRDVARPAKKARYYKVVAVDAAGNTGTASAVVSATPVVRTVSDVDGTANGTARRDDIVTFTGAGNADVFVALSDGIQRFVGSGLPWNGDFAAGTAVPFVGDVDGDGLADAVR